MFALFHRRTILGRFRKYLSRKLYFVPGLLFFLLSATLAWFLDIFHPVQIVSRITTHQPGNSESQPCNAGQHGTQRQHDDHVDRSPTTTHGVIWPRSKFHSLGDNPNMGTVTALLEQLVASGGSDKDSRLFPPGAGKDA